MSSLKPKSASEKADSDWEYNSSGLGIKRFEWTDWVLVTQLLQNNSFNLCAWEGPRKMANENGEKTKMQRI